MSVRARLTLWFVAALSLLVIAASTASYFIVRSELRTQAKSAVVALARAAATADPEEAALDRLARPGDRIWILDASGAVLAHSLAATGATRTDVLAAVRGHRDAITAEERGGEGRSAIAILDDETLGRTLSTLRWTLLGVGLGGLLLAGLAGALLARRALLPVDRMREEADRIPGDALDRRLAEGRPDELGRLAQAFNRLLSRAERAAQEQERFVADASHELKTPVTALEGHARIALRALDRGDVEAARESAGVVSLESRRLALMIRELLALAEAGTAAPAMSEVRLDEVVQDACEEMQALFPERRLNVRIVPATVRGHAGRLGELARILLDNAFKFSPEATPVEVDVTDGEHPELTVRDHGPGLSPEDREQAFDRFFRGGAAQGTPGSGLGLAIARATCERHDATITLDNAPSGGALATVRFPMLHRPA
jgi:two-component system, OmpR family, sensor histidine kinase MprB